MKQTWCVWFTSGGSGRGRVLLAPPWNVLRGVEGGAAVGVIYFVNIFRPQGPHSHPPWLISRMRLSARESIISSGYGPFKVFPQLSVSFSLGSWGAMVSCPAMQPPRPQGPTGRLTGPCSSRLMAPGPTGPISSACLTGPWVSTWQLPSAWAPHGLRHAAATGLTSVTPSFSVPSRTLWEIPGLEIGAWIFPLRGDSWAVTPLLHFPSS